MPIAYAAMKSGSIQRHCRWITGSSVFALVTLSCRVIGGRIDLSFEVFLAVSIWIARVSQPHDGSSPALTTAMMVAGVAVGAWLGRISCSSCLLLMQTIHLAGYLFLLWDLADIRPHSLALALALLSSWAGHVWIERPMISRGKACLKKEP